MPLHIMQLDSHCFNSSLTHLDTIDFYQNKSGVVIFMGICKDVLFSFSIRSVSMCEWDPKWGTCMAVKGRDPVSTLASIKVSCYC